jgi:hypothetical protein
LPSPVFCPRDRSHRQSPSANPVQRTSVKGSTPTTRKRPRVDTIKNALFESSCHWAETVTGSLQQPPQKERNRDVCPRNGPGLPLTGPSPGADPPTYPPSLPRTLGKLTGNIPSRGHDFFFSKMIFFWLIACFSNRKPSQIRSTDSKI